MTGVSPDSRTVAVGMSGGIDSTVAAWLLKEKGYRVVGLTMKIWDDSIACDAVRSGCYGPGEAADIADARRAADRLGIEHHVVDLCGEYGGTVLDYFSGEYSEGRTPNPCVVCNSRIKFGSLIAKARSAGIAFDLFATGHYARVSCDGRTGRHLLLRGADPSKDQSYFLHRLTQGQLAGVLFPLGGYRKEEVKAMARAAGFAEYIDKRESQDFLEWDHYGTLLKEPVRPGDIVDTAGKVIGRHRGIAFYTVGQRRALGLAGMKEPFYVLAINAGRNEVVAGPRKHLFSDHLLATDVNWIIPFEKRSFPEVAAKIRSTAATSRCGLFPEPDGTVEVVFADPQESITPGQSVVFYAGDVVIGGGVIER
jgi:tRNA-specific 2-thiouridylase